MAYSCQCPSRNQNLPLHPRRVLPKHFPEVYRLPTGLTFWLPVCLAPRIPNELCISHYCVSPIGRELLIILDSNSHLCIKCFLTQRLRSGRVDFSQAPAIVSNVSVMERHWDSPKLSHSWYSHLCVIPSLKCEWKLLLAYNQQYSAMMMLCHVHDFVT